MSKQEKDLYRFGPFSIDVAERLLLRDGQVVQLTPKAFDLLLVFVENNGHLVEKDELMRRLWPDTFVEEANLTNNISLLRKALSVEGHQYIETVARRGYRFVAEIAEAAGEPTEPVLEDRNSATNVLEEVSGAKQAEALSQGPGRRKRFKFVLLFAGVVLFGMALATYYFWPRPAVPQPVIRTIAVLPFKPLVADNHDDSLEMGMADTLITRLSNIRQIVVRPTSAVRKYAGFEQDAVAAGRAQNVDAVLEGSIQRSGDRIRVSVRLVRVENGSLIWADHFDEKFTDMFAVQDSISERVAAALAVRLTHEERELLTKHYTANTDAYQFYMKGRYFLNKSTEGDYLKSIEYFKQALEKDPVYALAYAGLADAYVQLGFYGLSPMKESHPRARDAAIRALELDDRLGEAHASLAIILTTYYWQWAEAEKQFKRAIELSPNYAMAHNWYSQYLSFMGRSDEAIREAKWAQQIDPLSLYINSNIGLVSFLARQYDQAVAASQKTLELDPNFAVAHMIIGLSYVQMNMHEEGISELQKAKDNPDSRALLGYAYAVAGNKSKAREILGELDQLSRQRYVASAPVAIIYTGLGENDRAIEWLEKAYDERLWEMGMLKVNPVFDSLRSDPRFVRLVLRVGLPE
jgi:DNA-binding winged helix-turn-helix (wHTH) protein/TolB-like protein/Tfp pilus assembly protein PilF